MLAGCLQSSVTLNSTFLLLNRGHFFLICVMRMEMKLPSKGCVIYEVSLLSDRILDAPVLLLPRNIFAPETKPKNRSFIQEFDYLRCFDPIQTIVCWYVNYFEYFLCLILYSLFDSILKETALNYLFPPLTVNDYVMPYSSSTTRLNLVERVVLHCHGKKPSNFGVDLDIISKKIK